MLTLITCMGYDESSGEYAWRSAGCVDGCGSGSGINLAPHGCAKKLRN